MFKSIPETGMDVNEYIAYSLRYIDAIDLDRGLAITSTNGRTKYAPKWTIMKVIGNRLDYESEGRVKFRAWTLNEAIELANADKRLINRINKAFGGSNE